MIHEYFQVTGTHETLLDFSDFSDLKGIKLPRDDGLRFDTKWDEVLLSIHEMPSDTYSGKLVQNTASRV